MHRIGWILALCVFVSSSATSFADEPPKGFKSLFNGKDLTGWKVPEKDNHWKVVEGVIDYNAKGKEPLWTQESFGDFILRVDWRLKPEKGMLHRVPYIEPDGSYRKDKKGRKIEILLNDVDSGIYLRGRPKSQVNIWCWPVGSGEVWGYRTDKKMPKEVRAGVTPKKRADKPVGEWNTFEIKMVGDRLWVKLNDVEVISKAKLPGVPKSGPIALQHHGRWNEKQKRWTSPPSLVQFRNIYIKELKNAE